MSFTDFISRPNSSLLLRGAEVAKELGVSRAMAYRMMQTGRLPVVRLPGSKAVRVPRVALLRWIEESTQGGLSTATGDKAI